MTETCGSAPSHKLFEIRILSDSELYVRKPILRLNLRNTETKGKRLHTIAHLGNCVVRLCKSYKSGMRPITG